MHVLLEPGGADGEEEVVTCGVEMSRVVGTLEILTTEGFVAYLNDTLGGVVAKHRDVVAFAHLLDGLANGFEAWTVHIPRCDVTNLGFGAELLDALDEDFERVAEHTERVGVVLHLVGIVVACQNDDVVGCGVHVLVAYPHGWTEVELSVVGAVESYAGTITPVVIVGETEVLRHLVVPGFFLGTAVVGNVGVTNDVQRLLCKGGHEKEGREKKGELFFHRWMGIIFETNYPNLYSSHEGD